MTKASSETAHTVKMARTMRRAMYVSMGTYPKTV
jgi:hypothetical protein